MTNEEIEKTFDPNQGIVGLAPFDEEDGWQWPCGGYDNTLSLRRSYLGDGNYRPVTQAFAISGHSREAWIALADVMIARWKDWRSHVYCMPEDTP